MIHLSEADYMGRGATRRCFIHPLDFELCIKIDDEPSSTVTLKEAAAYGKVKKRLAKCNFRYDVIPKFHGMVKTSYGDGGVYDLIRNETDGEVATTLSELLMQKLSDQEIRNIKLALKEFTEKVVKYWIISSDMRSHNLCVKKLSGGGYRIVCIDGLGHRDKLPLCDVLFFWARMKIKRHIRRYHLDDFEKLLIHGAGLKPAIKDL